MLAQTAACMATGQFELQRIGHTVLPLLAEVLRWFDAAALARFWAHALPQTGTFLAYVATLTLKCVLLFFLSLSSSSAPAAARGSHPCLSHSLEHVVRLRTLVDDGAALFASPLCAEAVAGVVDGVLASLPALVPHVLANTRPAAYSPLVAASVRTCVRGLFLA